MTHLTDRPMSKLLIGLQPYVDRFAVFGSVPIICLNVKLDELGYGFFSVYLVPHLIMLCIYHFGSAPLAGLLRGMDQYSMEALDLVARTIVKFFCVVCIMAVHPVLGPLLGLLMAACSFLALSRFLYEKRQNDSADQAEVDRIAACITVARDKGYLKARALESVSQLLNVRIADGEGDEDNDNVDEDEDGDGDEYNPSTDIHIHTFEVLSEWQLANNPKRLVYKAETCAICTMPEEDPDSTLLYGFFPCGHLCVCATCHKDVYEQQGGENSFCPLCRAPVYRVELMERTGEGEVPETYGPEFFPADSSGDKRHVTLERDEQGMFVVFNNLND